MEKPIDKRVYAAPELTIVTFWSEVGSFNSGGSAAPGGPGLGNPFSDLSGDAWGSDNPGSGAVGNGWVDQGLDAWSN